MQLKIIDGKKGSRQWVFAFDNDELRDVFLDVVAWNMFVKLGGKREDIMMKVLGSEKSISKLPDSDIEAIKNPFVKLVVGERKRLKIEA